MLVGEFCNRAVLVCDQKTSVIEAARLMATHDSGTLVVVDRSDGGARPLGVITERVLVRRVLARQADPGRLRVAELIDEGVPTALAGDGFWETTERMRARRLSQVAVVNDRGDLEGLLGIDDVLHVLADAQRQTVQLTQPSGVAYAHASVAARSSEARATSPGVAAWARVA